jgi:hypothetical protein
MTMPGNPSDFTPELRFDQYKLMVESAEHNSKARERTHRFYTTVHTSLLTLLALVAGYGLLTSGLGVSNSTFPGLKFLDQAQGPIIVVVSILGLVLCIIWRMHLNAYRRLSTAKFKVINTIERDLPYSTFQMEWDELQRNQHIELTTLERAVPVVVGILYVMLAGTYILLTQFAR